MSFEQPESQKENKTEATDETIYEKFKNKYENFPEISGDENAKERYDKLFGKEEFTPEEEKAICGLPNYEIYNLGYLWRNAFLRGLKGEQLYAAIGYYDTKDRPDTIIDTEGRNRSFRENL